MEKTLDAIVDRVELTVDAPARFSARVRMDDRKHAQLSSILDGSSRVVAGVGDEGFAFDMDEHFIGHGGLVLLTRRYREVERLRQALASGVQGQERARLLRRLCEVLDALGRTRDADSACDTVVREFPASEEAKSALDRLKVRAAEPRC